MLKSYLFQDEQNDDNNTYVSAVDKFNNWLAANNFTRDRIVNVLFSPIQPSEEGLPYNQIFVLIDE